MILNSEPSPSWIKEHPFVKNLKYLPIERVEYLLTAIFSRWEVEIKEVKLIANSIVTIVRLKVQNPLDATDWIIQEWVGAMPIQIAKWSWAIEFDKMSTNAIQIWAPASESFAIKDAAEKLWKIFGKDLNRKDTIWYSDRLASSIEIMSKMTVLEEIQKVTSLTDLKRIWISMTQKERDDVDISTTYSQILSTYENT